MQNELEQVLLDTQKEYAKSNRMKDKIIVLVIVLMFLEAIVGYCGFVWYESQFDYVTTEQKTMAYIADELGMSEITVKKKHSKMLMKIGRMF